MKAGCIKVFNLSVKIEILHFARVNLNVAIGFCNRQAD